MGRFKMKKTLIVVSSVLIVTTVAFVTFVNIAVKKNHTSWR